MLSRAVVEEYVLRHDWLAVLARARRVYETRASAVLDALSGAGAGISWSVPRGGFFTWVTLPAGSDVHGVLDAAIERPVVFVPGSAFHPDGGGTNQLRLAFSLEKEGVLAEGVRRPLDAIAEVAAA